VVCSKHQSTAHNLSDTRVEALRAYESLIVVCSPAAAASRWVNEEVRQFQALGRANRVLCMIVDGDPASPFGEGGCFPPALSTASGCDAEPRGRSAGIRRRQEAGETQLIAGLPASG
jgi:hypothetical protein